MNAENLSIQCETAYTDIIGGFLVWWLGQSNSNQVIKGKWAFPKNIG